MKRYVKWLLISVFTTLAIILLSYGAYKLYNYVIEDATKRIKQSVSEGVKEGLGKAVNPLKWPKGIFGGK